MTEIDGIHMRQRLGSEDGAVAMTHAIDQSGLVFGEFRRGGDDAVLEGRTLRGREEGRRERKSGNDGDGEGVFEIGGREGSQGVVGVF